MRNYFKIALKIRNKWIFDKYQLHDGRNQKANRNRPADFWNTWIERTISKAKLKTRHLIHDKQNPLKHKNQYFPKKLRIAKQMPAQPISDRKKKRWPKDKFRFQ